MSFLRLIYWTSLIGGWSAFVGWLFTELLIGRWVGQSTTLAILMATLVAIPIGGGISATSAMSNPHWLNILKRASIGFAGGLFGGLLGSLVASCFFGILPDVSFLIFVGRVLGWTLIGVGIGAGIGVGEGIFDRSLKKMRNGLIGGSLGGFLGGVFFGMILVVGGSFTSRAFAFVMLGLSIGLLIGLAQVILKEAWLTVEEGFRPGRQMVLNQDLATMGTSEKASLIFIAYGAKGIEPIHLRISKQGDGHFLLEDNQSRTGTHLNGARVEAATRLRDGDAIQFGVNKVRFNERVRQGAAKSALLPPAPAAVSVPAPAAPAMLAAAVPARPAPAIAAKPAALPMPVAAPAKPAPRPPAVQVAPKAVSAPAASAAPVAAGGEVKPQEGRCPICDKKIVGIPGSRRCKSCFTTF